MTDSTPSAAEPDPEEAVTRFVWRGEGEQEIRLRYELWGAIGLVLAAAARFVVGIDHGRAIRIISSAQAALQATETWEDEMEMLFPAKSQPPDASVGLPNGAEDTAYQVIAGAIVDLVWAKRGETAAAEAWWRLYPGQPPPWRMSVDELHVRDLPQ